MSNPSQSNENELNDEAPKPEENTGANDGQEDQGRAEELISNVANSLFGNTGNNNNDNNDNTIDKGENDESINDPDGQTVPEQSADLGPEEDFNEGDNNFSENQSVSSKKSSSQNLSKKSSSSNVQSIPIKKKATRKRKQEPDDPPQEEIDAALDLLLHNIPPEDFDPATLRCCIKQLQELKKDAVTNKNYKEANHYAELIKASQKAADIAGFSTQCTQKLGYLLDKQADAQEKVDEINNHWIRQFQKFEMLIDSKMQALTEQQTQELEKFDSDIPDELPPKYVKHSVQYVLMRKKEKLLIRNEDYLAADNVKQQADALEKEELTKQHMKHQDDLQMQRNALIQKHNQQYEAFALWMKTRRHEMLAYRDKDLEGPVRRLEHYTRLVNRIEKKGLPPNPYYGYTTNRVSRKESIKAVRTAAQTPIDRDPRQHQPREKPFIPSYRPSSVMKQIRIEKSPKSSAHSSSQNTHRSSSRLPPC
ncbi:hypothetical protein M9Y10_002228 [Tritrichomonas musculus]|uniref:Uncharacterized protein n=1 Tax=Tritrichomonas musculus TaxID=1915356 RepID=A0ABR2L973_9EUKA